MDKNTLYGEILYIGIVAEKGRVFTELRKYSYRKILKLHVDLWQKILRRMMDNIFTEEDVELLKYFIQLCKDMKDIGKYYTVQTDSLIKIEQEMNSGIETSNNYEEDMIIINFMYDLTLELVRLLNQKIFIDKNQIHLIIRTLHNLPRYFFQDTKASMYGLKDMGESFHNVIDYAFGNMNQSIKTKYEKYRL